MKGFFNDLFDKETGFFRYLIDRDCFKKKAARLAKKYLPLTPTRELLKMAKNAYQLQCGAKEELLLEIAGRLDRFDQNDLALIDLITMKLFNKD